MRVRPVIAPLVASCLVATVYALTGHTARPSKTSSAFAWTTPTSLPAPRARPAVAIGHDGNVYVFGGLTHTNAVYSGTNTTFIYNPRNNTWSEGATMPIGMEGAAAVTLPDGRIAVMGGAAGCYNTQVCTIYQAVEAYNPKTHSWCLLASMRSPRYLFAAALGVDGRVYAIGGWNGKTVLSSVEAYDPRKNTWTPATSLPQPEEGMAATVTHGRIVVIGGSNGAMNGGATFFYNNLFVYNGRRWNSGSPMPTPRSDLGVTTNAKGQIYAIGGYNPSSGYLATVERYDPATDSWSSATRLPQPVSALKALTGSKGQIYTFGGYNGDPLAQVFAYGPRTPQSNPFTS